MTDDFWQSLQKNKKVRKKGKALKQINDEIHVRDKNQCIIQGCKLYVENGKKFHHEPQGADKEDRLECGVTLCDGHHYERHHGENSEAIRQECVDYLKKLYG